VARNLLVVLLNDASLSELRSAVEERGDELPNVYVVAPARVGPLHWLATDEQAARDEAGVRALEAEWILSGEAAVGGEAGEADPTLAVEDALRRFPADEILLVGGGAASDGSLQASLRRLGVPISCVGQSSATSENRARWRDAVRRLASGRSIATPFVAFAGANLALLLIGVLITLVVAVIVWLNGLT
jgi:hypothetical protein